MFCRSLQSNLVKDNTWQNIIITWKSSDGRLTLFKNGANRQVMTGAQGKIILPGGTMYVGQLHKTKDGFDKTKTIRGSIADLQIWNTAVADAKAPAIYNYACQSAAKFKPGDVLSWEKITKGTFGGGQVTKNPTTCKKSA